MIMATLNETLNLLLKLTIGTGGYLESQSDRVAERVGLTVDDYIERRMLSGATGEQVLSELMADLDSDVSRIFGEYKTGMTNAVYGSANIAGTNGTVAKLITDMNPAERGTRLLRWQTNGDNICEDCQERHGEEDTLEGWAVRGLPKQFGSRCGYNCLCTLVSTDVILDPITLDAGQA
jgi:hypothetical protein